MNDPMKESLKEPSREQERVKKPTWADRVRVSSSENRFSLFKINHELTGEIPRVTVPNELTASSPKWEQCLVGYFPGSPMPFHAVREIALKVWKRFGLENVSAADGFFIFRFMSQEGQNAVLQLGPWLFGGKAFILQKWDPLFSFNKNKIRKVPVWVKLHALPLPLWTTEGLSFVSSILGTPIACDKATNEGTKLAYARVCIELEATRKPLKFFDLDTSLSPDPIRVKVEYEWKPKWCPCCLLFGHSCSTPVKDCEQQDENRGGSALKQAPLPNTCSRPKQNCPNSNNSMQPLDLSMQNQVVPDHMQEVPPPTNPPLSPADHVPPLSNLKLLTPHVPEPKNTPSDIPTNSATSSNQVAAVTKKPGKSEATFNFKRALTLHSDTGKSRVKEGAATPSPQSVANHFIPWEVSHADSLALIPTNLYDSDGSLGLEDSDSDMDFIDKWGDGDFTLPLLPAKPRSQATCGFNAEASLASIINSGQSWKTKAEQNSTATSHVKSPCAGPRESQI